MFLRVWGWLLALCRQFGCVKAQMRALLVLPLCAGAHQLPLPPRREAHGRCMQESSFLCGLHQIGDTQGPAGAAGQNTPIRAANCIRGVGDSSSGHATLV